MDNTIELLFGLADCKLSSSEVVTGDTQKPFRLHTFEYDGDIMDVCPNCGNKMYRHGTRTLSITDVPAEMPVKWKIIIPRRRCPNCKELWQPTLKGIDEVRSLSSRAAISLTQHSIRDAFENVGDDFMLSGNTVKNIFVDFLRVNERQLRFTIPAFLGIDEIKVKKLGELTVITDLEHKTLFDILQGKNQKALMEYFMNLEDREKVLWVCSDMCRPFQGTIGEALPNARWAIDHFHVVMKANEAVDDVRRSMQDNMTKKDRIKTKRGLAYTLKTRLRDLSADEASKLRVARTDPQMKPLMTAYDLKEDFFNIYDDNPTSIDNARQAFYDWERSIPPDDLYDKFRTLAKTVNNFEEQIFNFWNCPITISNGFTECSNRIIRENNLRGRGYSFEVLRGRTLYRKTNLERIMANDLVEFGPSIPENEPVFLFEGPDEEEFDLAPDTDEIFD
ncbi:ISL3 family transposase [Lacrimispora sp.]|uniref:ISL3 family transposase n=1 Tax=Lacrimispora sp. TaxID=2719234 RepID=UPI0028668110|nr:ISL3 family transposase [Lacrimispora sp.]MDR7812379.1 ISL3 family transposase [Lacrimispora sp.]